MKINVLIIVVLLSAFIFGCHKSSDDENTLNFDEIKNKIDAANAGDTVLIPEGTLIVKNNITINKNIILKGAGVDKTIVISNITEFNVGTITIIGNDGMGNIPLNKDYLRVTGITFKSKYQYTDNQSTMLFIFGTCKKFRVDHCKFSDGGLHAILIGGTTALDALGCSYGVIDHCDFNDAAQEIIIVLGDNVSGSLGGYAIGGGNKSWTDPLSLGTENAVYVEDCNFVYNKYFPNVGCVIADNRGARYVFRHNAFFGAVAAFPTEGCDAHGSWDSNCRGSRSVEIYNNVFNSENTVRGIHIRGGAGVIFDNTFLGNFQQTICLANYRTFHDPSTWNPPTPYTDINFDRINNLYIWNNSYEGNPDYGVYLYPSSSPNPTIDNYIRNNTDYFLNSMPGYTPYTYPHPLTKE